MKRNDLVKYIKEIDDRINGLKLHLDTYIDNYDDDADFSMTGDSKLSEDIEIIIMMFHDFSKDANFALNYTK